MAAVRRASTSPPKAIPHADVAAQRFDVPFIRHFPGAMVLQISERPSPDVPVSAPDQDGVSAPHQRILEHFRFGVRQGEMVTVCHLAVIGWARRAVTSPNAPKASSFESMRLLGWVFFLALSLLVVNDHFLKRAQLLPGWLTGKLSDFAGLIVASVALIALLRARSKMARAACLLGVTLPFIALKLSASLAQALADGLRAMGVPWQFWSDPTDLVALLVLPWVWRLSARAQPPSVGLVLWWDRLLLAVGAIGCLATSVAYEPAQTRWYLVSTTRESLDLSLHRARRPLDCDALAVTNGAGLTEEQFVFESCQALEPFKPMLLEGPEDDTRTPACDAVVLRSEGLAPVIAYRLDVAQKEINVSVRKIDYDDQQSLIIEPSGQKLHIAPTQSIQLVEASWDVPVPDCDVAR